MEAINNITDRLYTPMPKGLKEVHIYFSTAVQAIDKSMFQQK